jgi:hypothetical protein
MTRGEKQPARPRRNKAPPVSNWHIVRCPRAPAGALYLRRRKNKGASEQADISASYTREPSVAESETACALTQGFIGGESWRGPLPAAYKLSCENISFDAE